MNASLVATRLAVIQRGIYFVNSAKCALVLLALTLGLAGCSNEPDNSLPTFIGTNYAAVATNNTVGHTPLVETLALFYYPDGPKGTNLLLWPYLTMQNAVILDRLIVFNGGLSEDVSWKYYPALLAYAGNGNVVEISTVAGRHIPRWQSDWTNYAFSVLGASNHLVRLDASQGLPVNPHRPQRIEVVLEEAEIFNALRDASTNAETREFKGVKYRVAQ